MSNNLTAYLIDEMINIHLIRLDFYSKSLNLQTRHCMTNHPTDGFLKLKLETAMETIIQEFGLERSRLLVLPVTAVGATDLKPIDELKAEKEAVIQLYAAQLELIARLYEMARKSAKFYPKLRKITGSLEKLYFTVSKNLRKLTNKFMKLKISKYTCSEKSYWCDQGVQFSSSTYKKMLTVCVFKGMCYVKHG